MPPNTTVGPLTMGGPVITVSVAGVALGGDCTAQGGSIKTFACAITAPDCACQQSSVQVKVNATAGTGTVPFQIVHVRLVNPDTGQQLDQMAARAPQKWSGNAYVDWDQQIAPSDDFTASYKVSAPNWTVLSPGGFTQTTYRVAVDLLIGGEARTIGLDGVSREPPINT